MANSCSWRSIVKGLWGGNGLLITMTLEGIGKSFREFQDIMFDKGVRKSMWIGSIFDLYQVPGLNTNYLYSFFFTIYSNCLSLKDGKSGRESQATLLPKYVHLNIPSLGTKYHYNHSTYKGLLYTRAYESIWAWQDAGPDLRTSPRNLAASQQIIAIAWFKLKTWLWIILWCDSGQCLF